MKLNNLYKRELKLIAKVQKIIDNIPDGIVYTSIAILASLAVLLGI